MARRSQRREGEQQRCHFAAIDRSSSAQVSIVLFSSRLQIEERPQLLYGVLGARHGVAHGRGMEVELLVVTSGIGSVAEEVNRLEIFRLNSKQRCTASQFGVKRGYSTSEAASAAERLNGLSDDAPRRKKDSPSQCGVTQKFCPIRSDCIEEGGGSAPSKQLSAQAPVKSTH